MGLINKVDMVCFVACGIWCLADVSSVSPSSEQTRGRVIIFFLSFYTLLQLELVFTSYLFCPFRQRINVQKAENKTISMN